VWQRKGKEQERLGLYQQGIEMLGMKELSPRRKESLLEKCILLHWFGSHLEFLQLLLPRVFLEGQLFLE
jgi:hypothetical protein